MPLALIKKFNTLRYAVCIAEGARPKHCTSLPLRGGSVPALTRCRLTSHLPSMPHHFHVSSWGQRQRCGDAIAWKNILERFFASKTDGTKGPPSTEDPLYQHGWGNIPVLRRAGTFPSRLPRHREPKTQTLAAPLPFFPVGSTQVSSRTHPGLSRTGLRRIWGTKAKQIRGSSFSARNPRLAS